MRWAASGAKCRKVGGEGGAPEYCKKKASGGENSKNPNTFFIFEPSDGFSQKPKFLVGFLDPTRESFFGLLGPQNGHLEPSGKRGRLRGSPLGPPEGHSGPQQGEKRPLRGPRNGGFSVQNRFGSPGDPIHSQPVDVLLGWKEEPVRESQSGQPARQTDTPDRQTDRARARQTETDGPAASDGRPSVQPMAREEGAGSWLSVRGSWLAVLLA